MKPPKGQRGLWLRLCTLAVFSLGLLGAPAPGAAQAVETGPVVAWGCGGEFYDYGQCTVPSGLDGVTAVAAGYRHSLALKGGTVVAWGCTPPGQPGVQAPCSVPGGLSGVTAISSRFLHSLALKRDGTVVAWGNFDCRLHEAPCFVPPDLSEVTAIAAGDNHSLALKDDGTVVAWGCAHAEGAQDHGQCTVPAALSGVTAIASGRSHSLALKDDGTVVAWGCAEHPSSGHADYGQCSVPHNLSGVTAIAAGNYHSLALKGDGTVIAWGCGGEFHDFGQCSVPPGLSGVTAIAAGLDHSLALKDTGTVAAWGCLGSDVDKGQCSVPSGLSGVTAIAAGAVHSLAAVPAPNPIIFVHGFLGSKISCGSDELWPRIPPGPRLLDMRLADDGVSNRSEGECNPVAAPSGDLVETVLGSDVYESTVSFLRGIAPDRSYFYAWDWRKSPREALAGLDALVERASSEHEGAKVVLVAHSKGGLVTRWYIDNPSRAEKVTRALTIGTPYWGSPKALFPLAAGVEAPSFSGMDAFLDNDELKEFSRNLQGLYYLYPSRNFGPWLTVADRNPRPLDEPGLLGYVSTDLRGNAILLGRALDGHAANLNGFKTNGVDYRVVVGTGLPTVRNVTVVPDDRFDDRVGIEYASGDGTVPATSGVQGPPGTTDPLGEDVPIHYVCGIGHVPLPGHPVVTERIRNFILRGGPVVGTDDICPANGLEIEFFGLDIGPASASLFNDTRRASARTAAGDPPLTLAEAELRGLIDLIEWGDQAIVVTSARTPVTLTVSGEDLALRSTPLADESKGTPSYFGPVDGTLTLETGAGLVVSKDGAPVAPSPADTSPPVTKARIVVKGSSLELSPVARDESGVAKTFVRVGSEPTRPWTSPLELPLDADLSSVHFGSVDVFGNIESERAVPGNTTDGDAPSTTSVATPEANPAGWNATEVSLAFAASDGPDGSGVREIAYSLSGAETGGGVLPGAAGSLTIRSEGITTVAFSAYDRGGNAEPERTLTIRIDRTAPGITISSPAARPYTRGAAVVAAYDCVDSGSGVAACSGQVPSGGPIDTLGVGVKHFPVSATDRAGNAATQSVSYTVVAPRVVRQIRCLVPNVRGKRLAAARRAITRAHCSVGRVRRMHSAKVREGRVVSQTPRPGRRLRKGAKVNLVLSRGRR